MSDIEIMQDCEVDDDGDVGGWLDVFWCEGHGHDAGKFIRAVVDHCLDWGHDIPKVPKGLEPVEMWHHDRTVGDAVIHQRRTDREGVRLADWRPVTVLDCERRFFGGSSCSVTNCTRPVMSAQGFPIVWEPDGEYLALEMRLCDEHRRQVPEKSYRLRFIPVGATIMLDGER